MADEIKKKRGRPPLTDEEKALRPKRKTKPAFNSTKAGGYATQRRYEENHREEIRERQRIRRQRIYEPKLRIPLENKETLLNLLSQTGLTMTQLFLGAVEEKYGVILQKHIDNKD